MIRGVIFDLGATLIYTELDGRFESLFPRMDADLLAYLQAQGYALDDDEFIQRFAANFTAADSLRQVPLAAEVLVKTLAELGTPVAPQTVTGALRAYYAYSESLWRPVPGLHETLGRLTASGYKLAMISNASDEGNVQRLIDGANLRPYFDPIIVSAAVGVRKPSPRIFEMVLEQWRLPASECVMVGDTLEADILGAQVAGLHNVWITAHADHPAANRARRGEIIPEAEMAALTDLPALLETGKGF